MKRSKLYANQHPVSGQVTGSPLRNKVALALGAMALTVGSAVFAQSSGWWLDIANDRVTNVRQMLHRGVDPNLVNEEGLPALMLAIRDGSWNVYDALLADRRTKIEVQNEHGETPLMYLAILGETQRAATLIDRGAKVNRLGWTPLHYAAAKGHIDTANMLLERGAIVNSPAPDGTTPLMMAAYSGNREMIQTLLDHGADPTVASLAKLTAADWALERGHDRLAEELQALSEKVAARREGRVDAAPEKPQAAPEKPAPAPSVPENRADQASDRSSPSGTSRYFDLERFEREDSP